MKIHQYLISASRSSKAIKAVISALVLLFVFTNAPAAANFQHDTLFNPSHYQKQAEINGRVMIYDRLDNETIEQAMTQQFDRIGNMMFVRTRYIQKDGSVEESEDCE